MKITSAILFLSFATMTGLGVVFLPPVGGTNQLAEINRLNKANVELQSFYYSTGRIDRLEHEVDRLEDGFVVVAILVSSTFASLIALATRDLIRERKATKRDNSKGTAAGMQ